MIFPDALTDALDDGYDWGFFPTNTAPADDGSHEHGDEEPPEEPAYVCSECDRYATDAEHEYLDHMYEKHGLVATLDGWRRRYGRGAW